MSNYKYRLIKVKDGNLNQPENRYEDYNKNNPDLYVIQKRKLLGGWKNIDTYTTRATAINRFYMISNCKRDEDEVIMGA